MSAGLLALIAGGIGGYMKGTKDKADEEQLNEDRAYQNELRTRQRDDWSREKKLRDGAQKAIAPLSIEEDAPPDPIVANAINPGIPSPQNGAANSTPQITNPYDVMRTKGIDAPTQTVPMITSPNDVRRVQASAIDATSTADSPSVPSITNPMDIIKQREEQKKRYKVGDQVFEGPGAQVNAQAYLENMNSMTNKAKRLADFYSSPEGDIANAAKWTEYYENARREGLDKTMQEAHKGNFAEAERLYNRATQGKDFVIPGTLKGEAFTEMIDGVPTQSYRISGKRADGTEYSFPSTAQWLKHNQSFKDQFEQAATGKKIGIAEQEANTTEAYRKDLISLEKDKLGLEGQRLAIMRLRGTSNNQPQAPAFGKVDRQDSETLVKFAGNLYPDDPAKANKIAVIGAGLLSANPNMTHAEAIQLASTDGASIVNRQVSINGQNMVVPTLTITDAKGRQSFKVLSPGSFNGTIEPPPRAPAMPSPQKSGILPFLNNEPSKPQPSGRVLNHQLNVANQKLMADPQLKAIDQQLAELDKLPNRVAMNKRGALEAAKQQRINELQGK